jgi:exopolyphosphatase / guanosine-5'-triphosphate,3'-diphosphate pyrophosphatase
MLKQRRLIIDIGTNSVLSLLVDIDGNKLSIISDRKKTTKLGEGLVKSRKLKPEAIKRTIDAVAEFKNSDQYDKLCLLGTEALRIAENSASFSKALKEAIGCEPVILSGSKEAELSFLGAVYNLNVDQSRNFLIDVGGGSTELVAAHNGVIIDSVSVPIGALKLKESCRSDTLLAYQGIAEDALDAAIAGFHGIPYGTILATGGTITSVAAIKLDTGHFDVDQIHGLKLERDDLLETAARFEMANKQERLSLIPYDPDRADLILPGLGIFLAIMGIIGQESLVVSIGGIRFGAALYPQKI